MIWRALRGITKASTGEGCDGFHPEVPQALSQETRREIVKFFEKLKQCGRWPQQACTTMFFLIPKNVTSERPIALLFNLLRCWEWLCKPEVSKCQVRHRVGLDATDGRNGGAERVK